MNAIVFGRSSKRENGPAGRMPPSRGASGWGPPHGIPRTVKESFNVAGLRPPLAIRYGKNIRTGNAFLIDRLWQAGPRIGSGKTVPYMLAEHRATTTFTAPPKPLGCDALTGRC